MRSPDSGAGGRCESPHMAGLFVGSGCGGDELVVLLDYLISDSVRLMSEAEVDITTGSYMGRRSWKPKLRRGLFSGGCSRCTLDMNYPKSRK